MACSLSGGPSGSKIHPKSHQVALVEFPRAPKIDKISRLFQRVIYGPLGSFWLSFKLHFVSI